ncbi:uncharacterized protein LOC127730638 [Mytilus californianus]|uniref:uncharacterized protein LOC127730638 n=1 Tax=Mytilus californianus TaxID=6549 RepID=UPI002247C6AE|nr:uncharacterized protein LOC127730638 [Mytilus californianus]
MEIIKYIVNMYCIGIFLPVMGYNSRIPWYQNVFNDKNNNRQLQRDMLNAERKDVLDLIDTIKVLKFTQYMDGKKNGKRNWDQFAAAEKEDDYLDSESERCLKLYDNFDTKCRVVEL